MTLSAKPIVPGFCYQVTFNGADHVVFCANAASAIMIVAGYLDLYA